MVELLIICWYLETPLIIPIGTDHAIHLGSNVDIALDNYQLKDARFIVICIFSYYGQNVISSNKLNSCRKLHL